MGMVNPIMRCKCKSKDNVECNEISLDFTLKCYHEGKISDLNLKSISTDYLVLLFYPADFTFVCPTELIAFSEKSEDFKKLKATVVYVSSDNVYCHEAWCNVAPEKRGIGALNWPMVSDNKRELSEFLNVFDDQNGVCSRATVIFDTQSKTIKFASVNDLAIGRSTKEIIRLLKAI